MKLTENEKRDLVNLIENGHYLPDKYKYILFEKSDQVDFSWNGKSPEITNVVFPFQVIEQIDEPRNAMDDVTTENTRRFCHCNWQAKKRERIYSRMQ